MERLKFKDSLLKQISFYSHFKMSKLDEPIIHQRNANKQIRKSSALLIKKIQTIYKLLSRKLPNMPHTCAHTHAHTHPFF